MKKLYAALFAAALLAAPAVHACDAMKDASKPMTEKSSAKPSTTAAKSTKGTKVAKNVRKAETDKASAKL